MKRKDDTEGNTHHIFRHDQVLSVDLREFLRLYDPNRLSPFQLRGLFGGVSFELERAAECGDIATIPEARKFVRRLHAAWPWVGFFLDLTRPLGSVGTIGALPMLAYSLCLVDLDLCAWDALGKCAIRVDEGQLRGFRDQAFRAIDQLGRRARIPGEVLFGRKEALRKQLRPIL